MSCPPRPCVPRLMVGELLPFLVTRKPHERGRRRHEERWGRSPVTWGLPCERAERGGHWLVGKVGQVVFVSLRVLESRVPLGAAQVELVCGGAGGAGGAMLSTTEGEAAFAAWGPA